MYAINGKEPYCVHGAMFINNEWAMLQWTIGGTFFIAVVECREDIVSEWVEPPIVPWDKLPPYIKFVGMDRNHRWYGYVERPVNDGIEAFRYYGTEADFQLQPIELLNGFRPEYDGDWKKSLVKRPEDK